MVRRSVGAVLVAVLALLLNVTPARPPAAAAAPAGVAPAAAAASNTPAKTTLSIVAHEDDDLLFMNPDIYSGVRAGYGVWVVYLTDGRRSADGAPGDAEYADRRIQGVRAAYATMAGVPNRWVYEPRVVGGHEVATNRLEGTNVHLAFFFVRGAANCCRVPDPFGDLFRMVADRSYVARPSDGRSPYTYDALVGALGTLIAEVNPDYVRTPYSLGHRDSGLGLDHCDHTSAALVAGAADADPLGRTLRPRYEYWHYRLRTIADNSPSRWRAPKYRAWEAYVAQARDLPGPYAWAYGLLGREYAPADRFFAAGTPWTPPADFTSCADRRGRRVTPASWRLERGRPVALLR